MEEIARGALSKMTARLESNAPVQYAFRLDDREASDRRWRRARWFAAGSASPRSSARAS